MMNTQQQQQQIQQQQAPLHKNLVLVVEGTAALGPAWPTILSEYVEKIVRSFYGFSSTGQKLSGSTCEMALVIYNTHGTQSGCIVQRSGWTSNLEVFFKWLTSIPFVGGGFGDAAVAEGLAEALLMCCPGPTVSQIPQGRDFQKHCVLIGASNPRRIPTPVPSPPVPNLIQSQNGDTQNEQWWLADAETVAKAFSPCAVSLSVMSPRQLQQLREVFSQTKRSGRGTDAPLEPPKQNPHHLVLLSESFLEARMAFHRGVGANTMTANGLPTKIEHQPPAGPASNITGQMPAPGARPAPGASSGLGVISGRPGSNVTLQPVKAEAISNATVSQQPSMLHNTSNAHSLPASRPAPSQDLQQQHAFNSLNGQDQSQDFKAFNSINASQPLRNAGQSALPNSNMMVHSPSQSRHTINSPSLPPSSPLNNSSSQGGVSGSNIMSPGTGGALPSTQNTLGTSGQTVGASGMNPNAVGPISVGQGLGANPMMAATQASSGLATRQVPVPVSTNSLVQGSLGSSTQMPQNSAQSMMMANSATGQMMPAAGLQLPNQMQPHPMNNAPLQATSTTGTPPQQQGNNSMKYTRLWEGVLAGQRRENNTPIPICKLEGYRQTSSSETLAADWPQTMQIMRLIPQDFMNQKDYHKRAELLVFRVVQPFHDFLNHLAVKKLCAVIQLPSQTLLLSTTEKTTRMIGMLFPGDMVNIKPQLSSQQQQQQQQQQAAEQAVSNSNPSQNVMANNFVQNQLQGQLQNSLQSNQLQSAQLQNSALQSGQLQGNPLQSNQLQGNPLQAGQLQINPLQASQLQGNPLQAGQLQGNPLQANQLQGNALQANQFQGNPLQANQLQGNALQASQLQGNPLQASQLQSNPLQSGHLQASQLQSQQPRSQMLPGPPGLHGTGYFQ